MLKIFLSIYQNIIADIFGVISACEANATNKKQEQHKQWNPNQKSESGQKQV